MLFIVPPRCYKTDQIQMFLMPNSYPDASERQTKTQTSQDSFLNLRATSQAVTLSLTPGFSLYFPFPQQHYEQIMQSTILLISNKCISPFRWMVRSVSIIIWILLNSFYDFNKFCPHHTQWICFSSCFKLVEIHIG